MLRPCWSGNTGVSAVAHLSHFQLFPNSPHGDMETFVFSRLPLRTARSFTASISSQCSWVQARRTTLFTLQAIHRLALNHPKSSLGLQLSNRWTEKIISFVMIFLRSEDCLWSCYLSVARRTFITQHEEFGGGYFGRPQSALRRPPDYCWVLG